MKLCSKCEEPIAEARLKALPYTKVCVKCSDEVPVKGFMTWEHKTAPTFQIVTPSQHEWLQANSRTGTHAKLPMEQKRSNGL